MNFAKFFKNTFFAEYLQVTNSEIQKQPPEVFHKKVVLRNFAKFTEKIKFAGLFLWILQNF